MKSMTEMQQPQKLLCTIREAAHMLGLSMSTVRRYLDSGILKDKRIGKRRMFHVRDIIAFAEGGLSLERLKRVRESLRQAQENKSQ